MAPLEEAIHRLITREPESILAELLKKKLLDQGIRLSKRKLKSLVREALKAKADTIAFDHMSSTESISVVFTESDYKEFGRRVDKFVDRIPSIIQQLVDAFQEKLSAQLKSEWRKHWPSQRRDLMQFDARLAARWGAGLDTLRMLTATSTEFGSNIGHGLKVVEWPYSFDVLRRLHARACQISNEITALLSHGFADGAIARWRTLNEISAVCILIREHGEDLAERYLLHQIVETRKGALQYNRVCERLGQDQLTADELRKIEVEYGAAIAKYGPEYANQQGWAAKHLGKAAPTIADIQEAAKLDHLAPYYRIASVNVHANPKGVFLKLGLVDETQILLAGPSNVGLADPGHSTAISLLQITSTLLGLNPTLDNVVLIKIMSGLADEAGAAFAAAHKQLASEMAAEPRSQ